MTFGCWPTFKRFSIIHPHSDPHSCADLSRVQRSPRPRKIRHLPVPVQALSLLTTHPQRVMVGGQQSASTEDGREEDFAGPRVGFLNFINQ